MSYLGDSPVSQSPIVVGMAQRHLVDGHLKLKLHAVFTKQTMETANEQSQTVFVKFI